MHLKFVDFFFIHTTWYPSVQGIPVLRFYNILYCDAIGQRHSKSKACKQNSYMYNCLIRLDSIIYVVDVDTSLISLLVIATMPYDNGPDIHVVYVDTLLGSLLVTAKMP